MPKGVQRGNKETKKPKKGAAPAPVSVPAYDPRTAAIPSKRHKAK